MKKLFTLILASILLYGCGNKIDSQIESAVKEIYGKNYTVTKESESKTTFELSYEDKGMLQQEKDINPFVWRLDKISGVVNSGKNTFAIKGDKGVAYTYYWETPELMIAFVAEFYIHAHGGSGDKWEGNKTYIAIQHK